MCIRDNNYSAAGAIAFHIGEITISLSGLAVGALTGIIPVSYTHLEKHMSDKLCGLAGLGLDNLEDMDIFGQEKKEEQVAACLLYTSRCV